MFTIGVQCGYSISSCFWWRVMEIVLLEITFWVDDGQQLHFPWCWWYLGFEMWIKPKHRTVILQLGVVLPEVFLFVESVQSCRDALAALLTCSSHTGTHTVALCTNTHTHTTSTCIHVHAHTHTHTHVHGVYLTHTVLTHTNALHTHAHTLYWHTHAHTQSTLPQTHTTCITDTRENTKFSCRHTYNTHTHTHTRTHTKYSLTRTHTTHSTHICTNSNTQFSYPPPPTHAYRQCPFTHTHTHTQTQLCAYTCDTFT